MICFIQKYSFLIFFFIIVIKLSCVQLENFNKCEEEVEIINNRSIKWIAGQGNDEIVFSEPPCLDEQEKFIPRVCSNGSWVPQIDGRCKLIVNIDLSSAYITKPVTFDDGCNIKTKIFSESINNHNTFWLPFKRQVKFGPYEVHYTSPIANLKLKELDINEEFLQKDCIIFDIDNNTLIPEDCSKMHRHICEKFQPKKNLCEVPNCILGLDSLSCYCKVTKEACTKYPNINPYNKKMLQNLAQNEQCRVGNINSNIHGYENSYQIITRNKWAISHEPINCSICSIPSKKLQMPEVELFLSFEEESKELYLIVYHPENLLIFNENEEESISCFTNAAGSLSKRVKIKKVYSSLGTEESKIGTPFSAFEVNLEKLLGEYWCQAVVNMQILATSPKILAYEKKKGHEYALRLEIKNVCQNLRCRYNDGILDYDNFITSPIKEVFDYLSPKYRVMRIYNFSDDLDFLIHISTGKKDRDILREFRKLSNKLSKLQIDFIKVLDFKSSEYCLPETKNNLTWNLAELGESMLPDELCLDENQSPVFRVCGGDFLEGANWNTIAGNCINPLSSSSLTSFLKNNEHTNLTLQLLDDVDSFISNSEDIFSIDLYFLTRIFKNLTDDAKMISKAISIFDSVLNLNSDKFFEAQTLLNSSDIFLDEMEEVLSNVSLTDFTFHIVKDNILVFITDPFQSNISGIAVQIMSNGLKKIVPLDSNQEFDPLTFDQNIILAVQVPQVILSDLQTRNLSRPRIAVTIYFNDKLFINDNRKSMGNIVSVKIPGYKSYLTAPLRIYFNPIGSAPKDNQNFAENKNPVCAFWDYGKKTKRKKGSWSTTGSNYLGQVIKDDGEKLFECFYTHLTHFALLIVTQDILFPYGNDDKDDLALTVLATIAALFSVIGILGILTTALIFEDWRQRQGTKILLHISVAIFMEILLTEISEFDNLFNSLHGCIFFGVFLHYFVLSKFFWLLIYAFLQYLRFVKVFGSLPNNLVLKSVIVGWGIPLIPSLTVLIVDKDTYSLDDINVCYPHGYSMYFGVLLPIFLVVLINIIIFCVVMYQVSSKKVESHGGDSNKLKQFQLAALLFIMLGIPYIFALLSYLITPYWLSKIFIYIFTICATLQGFILFLFYIVFNNETRRKWKKYLHQNF